jgi:hypothetical protein
MDPSSPLKIEPLRPVAKVALAVEILAEYVPSWWILRRPNIVEMVSAARDVRPTKPRVPAELEHALARRLGRAVVLTLRLLPTDSRCLIRSLVLARLLARRAIPNTLVIGVRKNSDFEAHAWIEHEGRPVLPAGAYTRLTEL